MITHEWVFLKGHNMKIILLLAIILSAITPDVITPKAIEYSYKLMFEDRSISIWTYNLETLLAEKLETRVYRVLR